MALTRRELVQGGAAGLTGLVAGGAVGFGIGNSSGGDGGGSGLGGQAQQVIDARGLSPADVTRALKTFVPGGEYDEFYIFSSGGHSGQLYVIGVPSMRLLKVIGVFTPEPWQGFGYGADWGEVAIQEGTDFANKPTSAERGPLTWADTHHPALSETNGEYDGRWVYIQDRANGRVAMIDLRDFKVKQIFDIPNIQSSHGGAFVTPNTEYVHVSSKTPALIDFSDVDGSLDDFANKFRGFSTFVAVNPQTGRFDLDRSFQVELPPYTQDLADSGKKVSDGWVFMNSYNTEMSTGGVMEGKDSIEVGASANDFDYLHCVNWKKAEELFRAGRATMRNGIAVISMADAVAEGILYLVPEPRSPHGVDVSPDGNYLSIGGKLDPHVSIFSFEKLMAAIEAKDFEGEDRYGIPIVRFESVLAGQVEVGAGPLHTQYDAEGHGYISLFLESAVAKFTLGPPYFTGDEAFKLVDKVSVNYNIGHLVTMEGDTVTPQGKYLVSLNKWSIARCPVVGTLKPQNFQLVDLTGEKMEVLYDMPIGFGEPHYVQAIRADRIKAWEVYPPGTNALTMEPSPHAVTDADARVVRNGNTLEVYMAVRRSVFKPDIIRARKGDKVIIHMTNTETTPDATHGFAIPRYNIGISLDPGEQVSVEFAADEAGAFALYCTEFCSALHLEMQGWMLVS
ncbi:MAG TPA: Sec-dependent nitrous-oxide reductase [Tepidiformaceae bacterium]|nr:Sec-dependent nitrous-oxide reductase [Tepidiformaceae bacterium]